VHAHARTHYERETRAALPTTIPVADAVHNISRAAMLVNSFATGNMEALRYACQDVIHQVPGPPCPLTPALPSPPTLPTLPPLTSPAFKPPLSKLSRLLRPPHLPAPFVDPSTPCTSSAPFVDPSTPSTSPADTGRGVSPQGADRRRAVQGGARRVSVRRGAHGAGADGRGAPCPATRLRV
jgi:hypothetical protein